MSVENSIDREPLRFAYQVPETLRVDGRERHQRLAVLAERNGFDYALLGSRSLLRAATGRAAPPALLLLRATRRLKVIESTLPGTRHPAVAAKLVATADRLSIGRAAVHVTEPELPHSAASRMTEEFVRVLRAGWAPCGSDFAGDLYRWQGDSHDLRPKPATVPGRAAPEVFQEGASASARAAAARTADWYCGDSADLAEVSRQVHEVRDCALRHARTVRYGLRSVLVARDTEAEAIASARGHFPTASLIPPRRTRNRPHQHAHSVLTGERSHHLLIGNPEQVACQLLLYKRLGVGLLLFDFLDHHTEIDYFGRRVLPIFRALEADLHVRTTPPDPAQHAARAMARFR